MNAGYLLDSDVIIGFTAHTVPAPGLRWLREITRARPHISVISRIEVLRFNSAPEEERVLTEFVNSAVIHLLDEAIVQRTIVIGKLCKIKLPDAVIAATALETDRALVTRNVSDFKRVPGLVLVCPWDIT